MSEETTNENTPAGQLLPEEMKDKPVPLQFMLTVADALESRIDYNFNSLIQISMLVEYIHTKLNSQGIEIKLDEEFKAFQETRLQEIQQEFEKIKQNVPDPQDVAQDLVNSQTVDLKDD